MTSDKSQMKKQETAISHKVSIEEAGERLDRLLARSFPELSRSRIQALIKDGQASSNGKTITNPSYRVKQDQKLLASIPPIKEISLRAQSIPLRIPYEDNDLLVIDKPAGLAVHPAPGTPDCTLVNALLAHCGNTLSGIGGERRPGIVHRLDKDTSGLIVVAKNDATHVALAKQFQARNVERLYTAVVWGRPVPPDGEILKNIGRHPHNRKKMAVLPPPKGKKAQTSYYTKRTFDGRGSILECRLGTGRTHQIRVHMAYIGHPLFGDQSYGGNTKVRLNKLSQSQAETVLNFPRQALHAQLLGFLHPTKQINQRIESAVPDDIMKLISILAKM